MSLRGKDKGKLFEGDRKEETNTSLSLKKRDAWGGRIPEIPVQPMQRSGRAASAHRGWLCGEVGLEILNPRDWASNLSKILDILRPQSRGVSQSRGNFSGTENGHLADRFLCKSKTDDRRGHLHASACQASSGILRGKPLNGLDIMSCHCSGIMPVLIKLRKIK